MEGVGDARYFRTFLIPNAGDCQLTQGGSGAVGVALGCYKSDVWALVDAELYLPQVWFDEDHAELRHRWHIPQDRVFMSKSELGLQMIRRQKPKACPLR